MGSEVQGEGSSSRRGEVSIATIGTGAGGEERIVLSDGSFFLVPAGTADTLGVRIGSPLGDEDCDSLRFNAECHSAARKGLDLIAIRDHSVYQLRTKLLKRGFSEAAVSSAVDELVRSGYLDDRRFAVEWLGTRLRRKPAGRGALRAGLSRAGVDRATIESVLTEHLTDAAHTEALSRTVQLLIRRRGMTLEKLILRLQSRGFSYPEARRAAEDTGLPRENGGYVE